MKLHTIALSTAIALVTTQAAVAAPVSKDLLDRIASSEDASIKGLHIAEAADIRDEGWGDWKAEAEMVLLNSHGQTSSRQMSFKALEQMDEGDKRLIVFDQPRDVKGTAFLVFSKKVGNDDRWLYLPALKRVKRISSSNQSGPFVGSEFAYEDLSSQEVEKYTYQYVRKEQLNGIETFVVERIPTDPKSGYTRQLNWYDVEAFRTLKTEYYDRKGELLKTFEATDWKLYEGEWWRAHLFTMVNHQTGKSTQLKWSGYAFSNNLGDREFSQASLRNAR